MGAFLGTFCSWIFIALACGCLYGCPQYNVYSSRLEGEAELAKSEYSKQVMVQTATSKQAAAKLEADTDVIRAKGVASANAVLAQSLGGPEGYLRWKYIQMLEDTANSSSKSVIYVPTEGAMPILEAGKRPTPKGEE